MESIQKAYDVIVVGAGTAGMPTAIFAAQRGASVLLIEQAKKVGGTLWYSGGQMAATGTRLHDERGIDDTPEEFLEDMRRICHSTFNEPIYQIHAKHSGDTIDWLLDHGYNVDPECPGVLMVHEPYFTKRSFWSPEEGKALIKCIEPVLMAEVKKGGIDLRFDTECKELIQDEFGAVTGIVTKNNNGDLQDFSGSNVVITTGGYAANPQMFQKYSPGTPHYSATNPKSLGKGIALLEHVDAKIEGGENVLPSYACVLDNPEDPLCSTYIGGVGNALSDYVWLDTAPQSRQPWEVHINLHGERFLREDVPSVDERELALEKQPEWRMFIVFDEGVLQNAPKITPFWTDAELRDALGSHPSFLKADSLAGLAEKMGVDTQTFEQTIARYNGFVSDQSDPDFGREILPKKIEKPPFYAIHCVGMSVMSPAGVVTDETFNVIDQNGQAIPNLYAAGEVLGFGRLGGHAFIPGGSVTPALTFGRLLGQSILQWRRNTLAAE
ncbi:MAG: FAD-dependent oxidoreductase [Rhodospirillaceae bacterium]